MVIKDKNTIDEDLGLKDKIKKQYMDSTNETIIDFNKLTNGNWDKMYVITPYTDYINYCRKQNIDGAKKVSTTIETNDSINLILFVSENDIVSYINLSREYGDFFGSKIEISKNKAKYKLNKNKQWENIY